LGTSGQLGNGGILSESTPVVVSSPDGVIFASLNSSFNFSCAIGDDNNAYCWGDGVYGRLGNGTTQLSSTPTKVSFVAGAAVDKLILSGEYSCGILSNGKAYCWGRGGVLGTNTIQNDNNSTPLEVTMPIAN
jgi:alpha-tubulin suppressor-like RCC1 family protein